MSKNYQRVARWRRRHRKQARINQYKYMATVFVNKYANDADMARLKQNYEHHNLNSNRRADHVGGNAKILSLSDSSSSLLNELHDSVYGRDALLAWQRKNISKSYLDFIIIMACRHSNKTEVTDRELVKYINDFLNKY